MKQIQTVARPRTKPAEVRREELMDAAQKLFLEKGFAATSVDEIVRDADVAKGTFYLHFKSKDDILAALQQRFIVLFLEYIDAAVHALPPDDHAGRLLAWSASAVNGYIDRYRLHDLVFHNIMHFNRRMKRANRAIANLQALLEAGVAAGAWTLANPRVTAVMLFSAMHGAVDDALGENDTPDRALLVEEVGNLFAAATGVAAAVPSRGTEELCR
ncbi:MULTISPECIES: TetR/AcrR family transcriptional regulator [unclassified Sinorhizobium]|uniref:TetR/AcrR family transcriptional regulator n=1 Tax=unclassified Sinorhizobium TaxID=2613772 RepID=UPI0035256E11